MDRVAAVEAQLNRKENRRLRLKQLEARKRQQERQRNERDAKREEYYRRQMAAEEQLCRNVWDEEKRIVQEELRKKDEVVAAKVREDIVKIRKQANELGIDVRTPGLGGIKRLEALQQRIKHLEDSKERSMEARKRFDDRQEQAPKNRREIVNYAAQQFKTNFIAALDTLNSKEVKHMIDHGADPNCQSVNGVTPLVRAILEGHKYLLRELIKAGADPNFETKGGNTALLTAIALADIVAVQVLVELGANITHETKFGVFPVHFAVDHGCLSILRVLLDREATAANLSNKDGTTPLLQAAKSNQILAARLLLRFGADPERKDKSGARAVDFAKWLKFDAFKDLLCNAFSRGKLSPDSPATYDEKMEARSYEAARLEIIKAMSGSDASDVIHVLKTAKVISPNFETLDGEMPLLAAIRQDATLEEIHHLIQLGCIPHLQNRQGENAIMCATRKGRFDLIGLFIGYFNEFGSSSDHQSIQYALLQRNNLGFNVFQIANKVEQQELANFMRYFNPHNNISSENDNLKMLGEPFILVSKPDVPQSISAQQLIQVPDNIAALAVALELQPRESVGQPERPSPGLDMFNNDKARSRQIIQTSLRQNQRKKEAFDLERMRILKCRQRGRRAGFLATSKDEIEGVMKLPFCQECKGRLARKRCVTCCRVMCDQCYAVQHLAPQKRHHEYTAVKGRLFLDGIDYETALKKRANMLQPDIREANEAVQNMKKLLKIESPLSLPSVSQDLEVLNRDRDLREKTEQKAKEKTLNCENRAAINADKNGLSLFKKPAEISLGQFLIQQSRFDEARDALTAAYNIQEAAYGKQHHFTALTILEMGHLYRAQQKFDECIEQMQEALRILEDVLPLDHPDVIKTFDFLSTAFRDAKKYDAGIALNKQAKTMRTEALGSQHKLVVLTEGTLGRLIMLREMDEMYRHDSVAQRRDDLELNRDRYAAEALGRLPEQFMELLCSVPEDLQPFRAFAKAELQDENLNFWFAVADFQKMQRGSEEFRLACRHIYNIYIKKKRIRCLTAMIRNRIRRIFNTPGRKLPSDLFSQAQELVFHTMHQGVYFRYIETERGKRWYMDRLIMRKYSVHLKIIQRTWRRAVFRTRHAKAMKKKQRERDRAMKRKKELEGGNGKKKSSKISLFKKKKKKSKPKGDGDGDGIDLSKTAAKLSAVKT